RKFHDRRHLRKTINSLRDRRAGGREACPRTSGRRWLRRGDTAENRESLRAATIPSPRPTLRARPAGSGRADPPRWLLPSTDRRIGKDRSGPDLDERSVHIQYVTEFQYVTKPSNFLGQINPFLPARRRPTLDHSLVAGDGQRQWLQACLPDGHLPQRPSLSRGDTAEPRALAALAESERDDWRAPVRRSTGRDRRSEPCAPISFAEVRPGPATKFLTLPDCRLAVSEAHQ